MHDAVVQGVFFCVSDFGGMGKLHDFVNAEHGREKSIPPGEFS